MLRPSFLRFAINYNEKEEKSQIKKGVIMKFLLLTAQKKETVKIWVCQETSPVGSILPPMDLAYIAAAIQSKGGDVALLDMRLYENPLEKLQAEITRISPDAIVLNVATTSAQQEYETLAAIPSSIKKICYGTHAQTFSEECFSKGADYILVGDPEVAVMNLINEGMDGMKAEGVLTKENKEKNPAWTNELDTLPFAALDLLDVKKYHAPYLQGKFMIMLSSRGCPFSCTFCLYPVFFGKKYRFRSSKNIVDEMQAAHDGYGINHFFFLDATFNSTEKKVFDLCKELIQRQLNVSWICNMRAPGVRPEMLQQMKKAGCDRIFYGVEDPDYLHEIQKGATWKQTIDAFRETKKAGIKTVAFMMLFDRDDITKEQYVQKFLERLDELKADSFQCNVTVPFPGTKMYEEFKKTRQLAEDWGLFDPGGENLPYKTNLDLGWIKREVYIRFAFSNPRIILKTVSQMRLKSILAISNRFLMYLRKNLKTSTAPALKTE